MAKTNKPRLNFTLDEESKDFIEEWARQERRSVANLLEGIVLEAVSRKKQVNGSGHS
ncbi:hypothetical protein [Brasilonema sp. UFV-L1]|uniref:ribbon-helix-helix domain-containing protein n=1 Tax=Brasilonema sp. UFV-L1 TaxID=2234130 RepID=UPI00145D0207|nr:hypothetical protein [Brasilonema sp. UFV-L1]NMG05511.1 hypothetical protein [Brasilonema sp. UFV-L1]